MLLHVLENRLARGKFQMRPISGLDTRSYRQLARTPSTIVFSQRQQQQQFEPPLSVFRNPFGMFRSLIFLDLYSTYYNLREAPRVFCLPKTIYYDDTNPAEPIYLYKMPYCGLDLNFLYNEDSEFRHVPTMILEGSLDVFLEGIGYLEQSRLKIDDAFERRNLTYDTRTQRVYMIDVVGNIGRLEQEENASKIYASYRTQYKKTLRDFFLKNLSGKSRFMIGLEILNVRPQQIEEYNTRLSEWLSDPDGDVRDWERLCNEISRVVNRSSTRSRQSGGQR